MTDVSSGESIADLRSSLILTFKNFKLINVALIFSFENTPCWVERIRLQNAAGAKSSSTKKLRVFYACCVQIVGSHIHVSLSVRLYEAVGPFMECEFSWCTFLITVPPRYPTEMCPRLAWNPRLLLWIFFKSVPSLYVYVRGVAKLTITWLDW